MTVELHHFALVAQERLDGEQIPDYGPGICCFCSARVSKYSPPVPGVLVRVCARCSLLVPEGWEPEPTRDGGWVPEPGDEAAELRAAFIRDHAAELPEDATRTCPDCEQKLPLDAFRVRPNGYRERLCRTCHGAADRLRRYGRREKLSDEERLAAQMAALKRWRQARAATMQTCTRCGVEKAAQHFPMYPSQGRRSSRCKKCHREIAREAYHALSQAEKDRRNAERVERARAERGGLLPPEEAHRRRLDALQRGQETLRLRREQEVAA